MSNDKPVYTLETSKGKHDFTTNMLHTQFRSIEEFLKAHDNTIRTLGITAQIVGVYMTHRGSRTRLK